MTEQDKAQVATETDGQAPEVEQQGTSIDDLTTLQIELNRARSEAAKYRKAAQAAAEAEEQRKREEMSEVERLKADMAKIQAQAQEAEARAQRAMIRAAVVRAANGFNDPSDAIALLDLDSMEADEQGKITGLEEAIAKLLKEKPYLAKSNKSLAATNPAAEKQAETYDQFRAKVRGRAVDYMFAGGGVVVPEE